MDSKSRKENGSVCGNLSSIELINIDDVPELILLEVLLRLPVKVLFKFKIVSKQWLSMISDLSFARMYVSRSSLLSHSQNWTLIDSLMDEITSLTAMDLPVIKLSQHECSLGTNCLQQRLILPIFRCSHCMDYTIVGVSNGLVLYDVGCRGRIYDFYICNPITGQMIVLPNRKPGFVYDMVGMGFVTQVEDNVLSSYIFVGLDSFRRRGVLKFSVYFSEIRKWEDFDIAFSEEICFEMWKKSVVLDKILHQMISKRRIMAYDPYNKPDSVRVISLPGDPIERYGRDRSLLDQHQGHLRFFVVESDGLLNASSGSLSIWVLNDYECGKWFLQHRVRIGNIRCLLPLSFHPCDPNIVYMMNKQALSSYDFKTRKLKIENDLYNNSYPCEFSYRSCFLFVIPPWPVSINPSIFAVTED